MADISEYIAQIRDTSNGGAEIREPIALALSAMNTPDGVATAKSLGGIPPEQYMLRTEYEEAIQYDDVPTKDSQKANYGRFTYAWANEYFMKLYDIENDEVITNE